MPTARSPYALTTSFSCFTLRALTSASVGSATAFLPPPSAPTGTPAHIRPTATTRCESHRSARRVRASNRARTKQRRNALECRQAVASLAPQPVIARGWQSGLFHDFSPVTRWCQYPGAPCCGRRRGASRRVRSCGTQPMRRAACRHTLPSPSTNSQSSSGAAVAVPARERCSTRLAALATSSPCRRMKHRHATTTAVTRSVRRRRTGASASPGSAPDRCSCWHPRCPPAEAA
eukprot:scaffold146_cov374-Prasinococcus_capsulatus_cf.AAC.3